MQSVYAGAGFIYLCMLGLVSFNGSSFAVISTLRFLAGVILFLFLLPEEVGANGVWMTMAMAELYTMVIFVSLDWKKEENICLRPDEGIGHPLTGSKSALH